MARLIQRGKESLLDRRIQASADFGAELELPATLIVGEKAPQAFGETDRARAEGTFRLAVALPLAALILVLMVRGTWLWALALIGPAVLAVQGLRRVLESQVLIRQTFEHGGAPSPAMESFAAYARSLDKRETRDEERRSEAKRVLDEYRGPLLAAAWELGDRLDNIRNRHFLDFAEAGSGREIEAKLTTLFRLAQYFGWREILRTDVQLLRFDREDDTKLVAALIGDIVSAFASDELDGEMLWAEEQRGIGELMVVEREGRRAVRGYSSFVRQYDSTFADWMDRVARGVLSPDAEESDRLRILQWALFGLVRRVDEELAYGDSWWMSNAQYEIREENAVSPSTTIETRLREHLEAALC